MCKTAHRLTITARAIAFVAFLLGTFAQAQDDVAMRAMKDEMARSMSHIQLQGMDKPYFLAYRLDDLRTTEISATLGSLTQDQPAHMRFVGVEVRVGDAKVDNTNFLSSRTFAGGMPGILSGIQQAPLDENYEEIRRALWMATDAQYKKALEDLSAKHAALQAQSHAARPPDFAAEPVKESIQPLRSSIVPEDDLKKLARDLSAVFRSLPDLYASSATIECRDAYTRYVNSEGSNFTRSQRVIHLKIDAQVQSADGLPISDSIELYGSSQADFPPESALLARTRAMADRILKLRSAGSVERYNGPVLFEGEAAPEIFAQAFAPGLVAARTPTTDEPQFEMFFNQLLDQLGGRSFEDKLGGRVLPGFLNVSDNPTLSSFQGERLMGTAGIDDDAVATREIKLVEHGILETLLATRVPTTATSESTGSRRGWGPAPSNLLITSDKPTTEANLRKQLLQLASDRGLKYGIIVRHVGVGSAAAYMRMAARMMRQEEQGGISLAEVYKLYPDGHEELLQGIEIAEITPAQFKDIQAAGDTPAVYSDQFMPRAGVIFSMGISSGSEPPVVSYAAPAVLFEEVPLVKIQGLFPSLPVGTSPLAK